ncbi:MAG: 7-carboxy-7-deazaguanine synthase QueE [Marinilabiliaceae bacterium]|nr:7-carboxy-7-deazaguanine synthase QueE [Marinilabiliaceae bacterium]
MKKLLLSDDGIFPITKNFDGNFVTKMPLTGFSFAGTIQGEGKLAGTPSLFIRLSGCNLNCIWKLPEGNLSKCDTCHLPNNKKNREMSVEKAVKTINQNLGSLKHIVITGGEPLLQKETIEKLAADLKSKTNAHLTLETNGTIFNEKIFKYIDLCSISPKLKNSIPLNEESETNIANFGKYNKTRINIDVLQSFIDSAKKYGKDIQFKFVVANINDENEIKDILLQLTNYSDSDIMIMPLGANIKEMEQTQLIAVKIAVKNGWRFSPRLQINLFNNLKGV